MVYRIYPTFAYVLAIGPCHESLFESFSHVELRRLQRDIGNREFRGLVGAFLERYPIRAIDVAAGQHVAMLHHCASVPGLRLELPPAVYALVARNEGNAAHLLNELPNLSEADFSEIDAAFDCARAMGRSCRRDAVHTAACCPAALPAAARQDALQPRRCQPAA